MTGKRVHAFGDDLLGEHDAVALAELVASGQLSPRELATPGRQLRPPAISLPMAMAEQGVPIGVQLSAARGDERTLIETAFQLQQDQPFARIQDPSLPQPG